MQTDMINRILVIDAIAFLRMVGAVSQERMTDGSQMHSYLMRASSMQITRDERCDSSMIENTIGGRGTATADRSENGHFRSVRMVTPHRRIDRGCGESGNPRNKSQVGLVNGTIFELLLEDSMRLWRFGHEQTSGRIPVQAMDQNGRCGERNMTCLKKECDTVQDRRLIFLEPDSGMHGQPRGLGNHQACIILVEDRNWEIDCRQVRLCRRLSGIGRDDPIALHDDVCGLTLDATIEENGAGANQDPAFDSAAPKSGCHQDVQSCRSLCYPFGHRGILAQLEKYSATLPAWQPMNSSHVPSKRSFHAIWQNRN